MGKATAPLAPTTVLVGDPAVLRSMCLRYIDVESGMLGDAVEHAGPPVSIRREKEIRRRVACINEAVALIGQVGWR